MDVSNYYGKILIGENVSVLKGFDKNSIDLTVTSPPYDEIRTYKGFIWNFEYFKQLAKELYRVTKEGGIVVWVIGDQTKDGCESLTSFKQAIYFVEGAGFKLHDTMIYRKDARYPDASRYRQSFEFMFVFSKDAPKTFNPIKDVKVKYANVDKQIGDRNPNGELIRSKSKFNEMRARDNVWYYHAGYMLSTTYKKAFDHPAIFPEKLVKDHIISWTKPGDIVLDCFMGSGTTAVVAMRTRRKWIWIESSEEYTNEIAIPRIDYEKKRMSKRLGRKK